jgi:hypothetical protein
MFCLLFVGSLGFAQGSGSRPSGLGKRGWDSEQPLGLGKKGQEYKDKWDSMPGEVEAAKEETKAATEKAKEDAKVKAEKDTKAKAEKAEREAMKEERQKYFWEFWK